MQEKVRIVRIWLAALLIAAVGLIDPVLWFGIAPLFFYPGCSCCPACERCSGGVAAEYQLVFGGWANNSCAQCTSCNGTWIAPLIPPNDSCDFRAQQGTICGAAKIAELNLLGGLSTMTVQGCLGGAFASTVGNFEIPYDGTPIDCAFSARSFTYVSGGGAECNTSAATCEVTAL